jgi:hypothetical protein
MMEFALEGVISSVINIESYICGASKINSIGEVITVTLSVCFVVLNIVFAIVVTRLLIKNRSTLDSDEYL